MVSVPSAAVAGRQQKSSRSRDLFCVNALSPVVGRIDKAEVVTTDFCKIGSTPCAPNRFI